jgi:DNA end-binding protein Ku
MEYPMPPRAYWKGNLRLSLVSCPIELYPATSAAEKVSFNQINSETGNRIKYQKVDAGTGDPVDADKIVKGYQVSKGEYVTLAPDELEAVALETTHAVEIQQFVPEAEIDELYYGEPYYVVPGEEYGEEAFAVLREAISEKGMVAIGRVVFRTREHMVAIKPRDKGMVLTTLLYPYEVRKPQSYFGDISDQKIDKEMIAMAHQIIKSKIGHFQPDDFEDRYETALREIIGKKMKGARIVPARQTGAADNVVNLMDALRKSIAEGASSARRSRAADTRAAKKPARSSARARKAG